MWHRRCLQQTPGCILVWQRLSGWACEATAPASVSWNSTVIFKLSETTQRASKFLLVFWEQYSNIPPLTNSNFCICGLACEQHADNLLCLCWFAALANHIWIDVSAQMRQYVLLICFYDNRDLRHGGYIRLWLHRHNLLVAGAPLAFIAVSWDPLVIMKIF